MSSIAEVVDTPPLNAQFLRSKRREAKHKILPQVYMVQI